ncbi:hypothetical protein GGI04_004650 [Coemansia thaxteri]|nr:hypothetical protein GGI04_004650 [Coemansia thaxteri]
MNNWWDQSQQPSHETSDKDWAQYYQSLEAYHSQQQPMQHQAAYVGAPVAYANYPPSDYSSTSQWFHQSYPQQQVQQQVQPYQQQHQQQPAYPAGDYRPPPSVSSSVSSFSTRAKTENGKSVDSRRSMSVTRGVSELAIKDSDFGQSVTTRTIGLTNQTPLYSAVKWPDSLKRFVERSYAASSARVRHSLEKQLTQIISAASSNKKIFVIDWDVRPLPKACDLSAQQTKPTPPKKRLSSSTEFGESVDDFASEERKERRLQRFQKEAEAAKLAAHASSLATMAPVPHTGDVLNWDADTIVGTCTKLEKSYLRLTSAPDPAVVRPLPILRKTLDLLKRKWVEDSNYTYICDQFKSLRQDLTVQRITNGFTVEVYEQHARIALETNDLGEYNQCQTQLKQLYELGLPGHAMEFLAYRILYFLYTRNKSDINTALAAMMPEAKRDAAVQHALSVRSAMATGNYFRYFQLYTTAPNMGGYLMDNFVDRERCSALQKMCKAYRPRLGLEFISQALAFDGMDECTAFLATLNIPVLTDGQQPSIDMKAASPYAAAAMNKYEKVDIKGQIY